MPISAGGMASVAALKVVVKGEGFKQLQKQIGGLEKTMGGLEKQIAQMGKENNVAKRNAERYAKAMDKTTKSTRRTGVSVRNLTSGFGALIAVVSSAAVALGKATEQGGRMTTMMDAFKRTTGDSTGSMLSMQVATRGLIDDFTLLEQYNRGVALGAVKTKQEFNKLSEAAITLGRAMNTDAGFALESLTLGIGRQSRLFLDNLGLIVKVEEAYRRYGLAIGKAGEQLTEQEQKEAFRIETFRKINEAMKDLGGITLNAGDSFKQLAVEITNAKNDLLLFLASSDEVGGAFQWMRRLVVGFRGAISGVSEEGRALAETWATAANTLGTEALPRLKEAEAKLAKGVEGREVFLWEPTAAQEFFAGAKNYIEGLTKMGAGAREFGVNTVSALAEIFALAVATGGEIESWDISQALARQPKDAQRELAEWLEGDLTWEGVMRLGSDVFGIELGKDLSEGIDIAIQEAMRNGRESFRKFGMPESLILPLDNAGILNIEQYWAAQAPVLAAGLDFGVESVRDVVFLWDTVRALIQELEAVPATVDEAAEQMSLQFMTTGELVERAASAAQSWRTAMVNMSKAVDSEKQEEFKQQVQESRDEVVLFGEELRRRGAEFELFSAQALGVSLGARGPTGEPIDEEMLAIRNQIELAVAMAEQYGEVLSSVSDAMNEATQEQHAAWREQLSMLEGLIVGAETWEQRGRDMLFGEELARDAEMALDRIMRAWEQLQRPGQFDPDALAGIMGELDQLAFSLERGLLRVGGALGIDHETAKKLKDALEAARDAGDEMTDATLPFFTQLKNLFTGSIDSLFSGENLKDMLVEGIGGALSSGINALVGMIREKLGDLVNAFGRAFGIGVESDAERTERIDRENRRALEENTRAIQSMVRSLSGSELGRLGTVVQAAVAGYADDDVLDASEQAEVAKVMRQMRFYGSELADAFEEMGLTFQWSAETFRMAMDEIMKTFTSFAHHTNIASWSIRAFDLDDIEDPIARAQAQFDQYAAALAKSLPMMKGLSVLQLDFDNIEQFVQNAIQRYIEDPIGFALDLGPDITPEEYIEALLGLEELADTALEAADGLGELGQQLRNVPAGFKVALEQFRADTGEIIPPPTDTAIVEPMGDNLDVRDFTFALRSFSDAVGLADGSLGSDTFQIENLNVYADDVEQLKSELENAARREARRGGVSNNNLTQGGTGSGTEVTKGGFRA